MADSFAKLKELDLSREEVERLGEALKKEEFRKLLSDYVAEVQDPKNQKVYQEEITQLEAERGNDVTFINPQPGYVIKTSLGGNRKCFVNVCTSENVKKPTAQAEMQAGSRGLQWSLPHACVPQREDVDNKGARCVVYDVVFHPDTLRLASKNKQFYNAINNTACDAIEQNFEVTLDRKNLKFPKLQYKGSSHASIVRTPIKNFTAEALTPEEQQFFNKIYPKEEKKSTKKKNPKKTDDGSSYTCPAYVIKHRTHVDIQEFVEDKTARINATVPRELVVEVNLPLLKASQDITLDVTEKTLQLQSEKPAKYKLNLTLPYRVNQENGNAKFDKDLKKLIVSLPVRRSFEWGKDDSGVESDHWSPCTPPEQPISDKFSDSALRTNFLDENLHYNLPEFTCNFYENTFAFTLNVKNVKERSIVKDISDDSLHVKFTSIGSSYYPVHYAFYVKLAGTIQRDRVLVETWDNNVILQVPIDGSSKTYHYGLTDSDLKEKPLEEPAILNSILQTEPGLVEEEKQLEEPPRSDLAKPITISGLSYESSGDELSLSYSPSKSKGILKRLSNRAFVGRSISESSLDDYVCSSFDSENPIIEEDPEMSTSLKKTVRFNDVIMRQLYRTNSSILGQKKKNQRKARNKKRAQERRHSESEASEVDDKKDETPRSSDQDKSDTNSDIFDMDMN